MERDVVLTPQINRLRRGLECHGVFDELRDIESLRAFMQVHVFAVWDFMSLVKRLQQDLTCVRLPWMPPADPASARLINDIVLAEESDVDAQGRPASHLDLYLAAMRDVGASTGAITRFLSELQDGADCAQALDAANVPAFVREFVLGTIETATGSSTLEVTASFLYGRENIIPGMFKGLLERWNIDSKQAPGFVYYLERHIELDGDAHGPAALQMIGSMLLREPERLATARRAARDALLARHALWDGTQKLLRHTRTRVFREEASEATVIA
ncbi:DUF3050 domain-containing protein [Marilutibacter alkalisoli]|uniref:DUF3050 domain-containing protein n=1 Tax=Marilutibacter alkalisoli TaxID=2591633 RepID=A0A514BUL0_9GAMM|nr:DUF3050 domain-containing protein [Lysobacter alkalisoli]QDH71056.1 DUF3050 domain-containing protein [Lysobacter alkalisoli]